MTYFIKKVFSSILVFVVFPVLAEAAPSVRIISPQNDASVSGVVNVQADVAGDAKEVALTISNEESGRTVYSDKSGAGRYNLSLDTLANRDADKFESGSYYLTVVARDSSGALGASTIHVTLGNGRYTPSARSTVSQSRPDPVPQIIEAAPEPAQEAPAVQEEIVAPAEIPPAAQE